MDGTIKFYNSKKGYGFITTAENQEVFFHATDIENQEELNEGDKVKYDTTRGDRGLKAIKVLKV